MTVADAPVDAPADVSAPEAAAIDPHIDPHEADARGLLRFKAEQGMGRLGLAGRPEYRQRLEYELGIIEQCGFVGYFLIVADVCRFCDDHDIRKCVRGSGVGSLVNYVLGVTHPWLDPLKLDIPFERFLNPDRISNPDVDIDLDDERRNEVIEYVCQKYGRDHVARIGTFGTLGARASMLDAARALQIPNYQELVSKINLLIPEGKGEDGHNWRIEDAIAQEPELAQYQQEHPELFDLAIRLQGRPRHTSVHACGTVVTPGPVCDYVPLHKSTDDGFAVTQWEMTDIEARGLLKLDFLGLKTLRVISQTQKLINLRRQAEGLEPDFDIDRIDQHDEATWKLLGEGRLAGVFQVEKAFVRRFARRMNLQNLKDPSQLAVLISIIRPGMMDSGMTEVYLRRAMGEEQVEYPHPRLENCLRETYGTIVFQEQAMRVCVDLSGFTNAQSDTARAVIGKKKVWELPKIESKFLEGAAARQVDAESSRRTWDLLKAHGRYSFNKGHSSAYGNVLTLQTAYLKANHPLEFMTALINSEAGVGSKIEGYNSKVSEYVAEAREMGLAILPPDLRRGGMYCQAVPRRNAIRFGLSLVKSLSDQGARFLIEQGKGAETLQDLLLKCYRIDPVEVDVILKEGKGRDKTERFVDSLEYRAYSQVKANELIVLVEAGAFDGFGLDRSILRSAILPLFKIAGKYHKQLAAEQTYAYRKEKGHAGSSRGPRVTSEDVLAELRDADLDALAEASGEEELGEVELLDREREVTGCFLTGTPLDPYRQIVRANVDCSLESLAGSVGTEGQYRIAAYLQECQELTIKRGKNKGKSMGRLTLVGAGERVAGVCFNRTWEKVAAKFTQADRQRLASAGLPADTPYLQARKVYLLDVEPGEEDLIINDAWRLSDLA